MWQRLLITNCLLFFIFTQLDLYFLCSYLWSCDYSRKWNVSKSDMYFLATWVLKSSMLFPSDWSASISAASFYSFQQCYSLCLPILYVVLSIRRYGFLDRAIMLGKRFFCFFAFCFLEWEVKNSKGGHFLEDNKSNSQDNKESFTTFHLVGIGSHWFIKLLHNFIVLLCFGN